MSARISGCGEALPYRVYVLPDDFPQRLRRFGEESGLTWAEMARRIETPGYTV